MLSVNFLRKLRQTLRRGSGSTAAYAGARRGRTVPEPGVAVLIETLPRTSRNLPASYQGTVADIQRGRVVVRDIAPLSPGAPSIASQRGEDCTISFPSDGRYLRVSSSVVSAPAGSAPGSIGLTIRGRATTLDRRSFFRMLLLVPSGYRTLANGVLSERRNARIYDLSAGGVKLLMREEIGVGARFLVDIPTGKDGLLTAVGAEVIESISGPEKSAERCEVRARFYRDGSDAISEETSDEIIRYIFEQQRLMLRARKLSR